MFQKEAGNRNLFRYCRSCFYDTFSNLDNRNTPPARTSLHETYVNVCRDGWNYISRYVYIKRMIIRFEYIYSTTIKKQFFNYRSFSNHKAPLIARFMGPTRGPSGVDRTQVGPMLAPWTLLSGKRSSRWVSFMIESPSLCQENSIARHDLSTRCIHLHQWRSLKVNICLKYIQRK